MIAGQVDRPASSVVSASCSAGADRRMHKGVYGLSRCDGERKKDAHIPVALASDYTDLSVHDGEVQTRD